MGYFVPNNHSFNENIKPFFELLGLVLVHRVYWGYLSVSLVAANPLSLDILSLPASQSVFAGSN